MKNENIINYVLLLFKGVLVGFGAIMPGISGGALCVAFGMYRPLLNLLSKPLSTIKKDGLNLLIFLLGVAVGFVALSGFAGWLMEKDSKAVTCVFIGFIIGTIPELWKNAGEKGRDKASYISMLVGFAFLMSILMLLKYHGNVNISKDFFGYLLCGIFWGVSFIIPGLSSSTLLIFFGLYQSMLEGISMLDLSVLIPLAIGMLLCLIALPKAVNRLYERQYSIISHAIIGIVCASMLMVIPPGVFSSVFAIARCALCIALGAGLSYGAAGICEKLLSKNTDKK